MNVVSVNCARARRDRCAIRTHCFEVLCCRARLQPAGQVCVCLAWKRLHRPRLVYKLRHLCSKFLSRHERSGVQGHEEATLLMMPHREKVSHNSSSNHQPGSSSQEAVSEHTDIQRHNATHLIREPIRFWPHHLRQIPGRRQRQHCGSDGPAKKQRAAVDLRDVSETHTPGSTPPSTRAIAPSPSSLKNAFGDCSNRSSSHGSSPAAMSSTTGGRSPAGIPIEIGLF